MGEGRAGIKLDLRVVETDMVADPFGVDEPNFIGGIRYDDVGIPLRREPEAWKCNSVTKSLVRCIVM